MTAVEGPAGTRWPGCGPPGAGRWQENRARAVQELQVVGAGSLGLSAGARVLGAELGQEDLSWKRPAPLPLLSPLQATQGLRPGQGPHFLGMGQALNNEYEGGL